MAKKVTTWIVVCLSCAVLTVVVMKLLNDNFRLRDKFGIAAPVATSR